MYAPPPRLGLRRTRALSPAPFCVDCSIFAVSCFHPRLSNVNAHAQCHPSRAGLSPARSERSRTERTLSYSDTASVYSDTASVVVREYMCSRVEHVLAGRAHVLSTCTRGFLEGFSRTSARGSGFPGPSESEQTADSEQSLLSARLRR